MPPARRLLAAGQLLLLAAAVGIAAALTDASDWRPHGLFWLLCALTILSGAFQIEYRGIKGSATFIGVFLASALLGPLPGVTIGVLCILVIAAHRRTPLLDVLCNLAAFATFAATAGAAFGLFEARDLTHGVELVFIVVGLFMATNVLNFLVIAVDLRVTEGVRVAESFRRVYAPCLAVELASGLLTATVAYGYTRLGIAMVLEFVAVGLAFQYLLHFALVATRRGDALGERTEQLASLQVGLLSAVLRTLSLRDKMTARHSAAVGRYARALAERLGLDEREQDLIHTAALLHDIGKFVFPDSILSGDRRLTDEEFEIVRSHPAAGAELVSSIEGYGPVAEIVLAHHERIDGRGYPKGIPGDAIPIGSRIIAVCDTFDVMTARDSYRRPVARAEAIAELRRVSGTQLDGRIVEAFIQLVAEDGLAFRHTDDTDFERELDLPRRIREYARPRVRLAA